MANKTSVVHAAIISAMGSAKMIPFTPKNTGRMNASGTNKITFLSNAINTEVLACPRAKKTP